MMTIMQRECLKRWCGIPREAVATEIGKRYREALTRPQKRRVLGVRRSAFGSAQLRRLQPGTTNALETDAGNALT